MFLCSKTESKNTVLLYIMYVVSIHMQYVPVRAC